MKNDICEYFKNKSVLILGYGREGKSTYKFLKNNCSNLKIGIADINEIELNDENVDLYSGDNYLDSVKYYDIVMKAPGVVIKDYIDNEYKKNITSQTDLFLRFCKNKVVGITGTKGKSTTSSLIFHILSECNYDTIFVGNIGNPCFDSIDRINENTIIVYELSCHQLEYVKASPNISIILNIYEEHLDHYTGLYDYINSKKNIYKFQNKDDYFIYCNPIKYLDNKDLNNIKSNIIKINNYNDYCVVENLNNKSIINKVDIKTNLIGDHNILNIAVCICVCHILGISENKIYDAIKTFEPLEHRLEFVGKYNDIYFYNDSIATAAESVVKSVESIPNINTLILGGMDRGIHYDKLVDFLENSNVKNIILLPNTGERISELFKNLNTKKDIFLVNNMEEAVKIAKDVTKKEYVCILSPAAPSYGFYKNFEERGNHFKKLVSE